METIKGLIRPLPAPNRPRDKTDDFVRIADEKGHIKRVKVGKHMVGLSHAQTYRLLRPTSEVPKPGEVPSIHTWINLDEMQPGGSVEEHFHESGPGMPVFDHTYYVISGRIRATIGDVEKTVGAGALIYCPSNVKHSVANVGKRVARVLKIAASGEGQKMGAPVYSRMPGLSADI